MVEFHSDQEKVVAKVNKAIDKALRLVGGQAERFAKETISNMKAVDTGFLRNSITWAIDGSEPNITRYKDDAGEQKGQYEGSVPASDDENVRSVYIGTNVYYAPYVELGTTRMQARPFLSSTIQSHAKDFEALFREAFSNFF